MSKGLSFIGDLLADINQGVTIDGSIGLVESIFGIEYDKSKLEGRDSTPQIIEVHFDCPYEREECINCEECEMADGGEY